MTKSIFVGLVNESNLKELGRIGANHLILAGRFVNKKRWQLAKSTRATLTISVNAFDHGECPADPKARIKLHKRIREALDWRPEEIWLDHFCFDGYWEQIKEKEIPGIHKSCVWCKDEDRVQVIKQLAQEVMLKFSGKTQVGYFAVPFKKEKVPEVVDGLGQDHEVIGRIFDMSSPMLYHRMIKKPASYISDFVSYINLQTGNPVLPIIQIKDMPDDLPDKLSREEFKISFKEARKQPATGVSIFLWEHAIEKSKVSWIKEVF